jgi:hypothetical protein
MRFLVDFWGVLKNLEIRILLLTPIYYFKIECARVIRHELLATYYSIDLKYLIARTQDLQYSFPDVLLIQQMLETSTSFIVLIILSLCISAILISGITYLLVQKTKGTWQCYSTWIETKKYSAWMYILSICYLVLSSGTKMCYIEAPVIFCTSASLLSIFTLGLLANVFVTYYVFCYCRLLSVYKGFVLHFFSHIRIY